MTAMCSLTKNSEQLMDEVCEDEEKHKRKFLDEMKDFPCSFNLGYSNLDVENTNYAGPHISEPELDKETCKYKKRDLEDTDENDDDFEDSVWRKNLLTLVYIKLDDFPSALVLNEKTVAELKNPNLVTLANSVFLHYQNNDSDKVKQGLSNLRKLKESPEFKDLKLQAIIEQAYEYRKFGGAKHLLCSIALLDFALQRCPGNERVQFMRAMVYRRCTHFKLYAEDPENIDRRQFAVEAAKQLFRLSKDAQEKPIRSAAFIELAYLKCNDELVFKIRKEEPILDEQQWFYIIGHHNWRTLCQQAVDVAGDKITDNVLTMAGQLFKTSLNNNDFRISEQYLKKAIAMKPSNTAHHHLGLLYRKMAIAFEREHGHSQTESRRGGYVGRGQRQFGNRGRGQRYQGREQFRYEDRGQLRDEHSHQRKTRENWRQDYHDGRDRQESLPGASRHYIPSQSENQIPQTLDQRLQKILQKPREKLRIFSKNNDCTTKAVEHFTRAVALTFSHNVVAHYDLATIYAQMEKFNESKQACQLIIKQATFKNSASQFQQYLANAYNLFGLCCAMEGEKIQEYNRKKELMNESEYMLVQAVRIAANLASNILVLSTAVTDLWNVFKVPGMKFQFKGSEDSKKKLFQLCDLIHDYRYVGVIDKMLSQDESVWENDEAMELCLKRYVSDEDINGALLFYEMILLRRGNRGKLTWHASNMVRQLMTKVAKRTLFQNQAFTVSSDPIWKWIFEENYSTSQSSQKYDIVIVQHVSEDDHEPRRENIGKCLKKILKNKLGLNVVHSYKPGLTGQPGMDQQTEIINKSHVAIFILSQQRHESDSLEPHLSTALTLDDGDSNFEAAVSRYPQEQSVTSEKDKENKQTDSELNMSSQFSNIINACVSSHNNKKKPDRILVLCCEDLQAMDLPIVFRELPSIDLSKRDTDLLNSAVQGDACDETVKLVMKIFKAVIAKN